MQWNGPAAKTINSILDSALHCQKLRSRLKFRISPPRPAPCLWRCRQYASVAIIFVRVDADKITGMMSSNKSEIELTDELWHCSLEDGVYFRSLDAIIITTCCMLLSRCPRHKALLSAIHTSRSSFQWMYHVDVHVIRLSFANAYLSELTGRSYDVRENATLIGNTLNAYLVGWNPADAATSKFSDL